MNYQAGIMDDARKSCHAHRDEGSLVPRVERKHEPSGPGHAPKACSGLHCGKPTRQHGHSWPAVTTLQRATMADAESVTAEYPRSTISAALARYIAASVGAQVPSPST